MMGNLTGMENKIDEIEEDALRRYAEQNGLDLEAARRRRDAAASRLTQALDEALAQRGQDRGELAAETLKRAEAEEVLRRVQREHGFAETSLLQSIWRGYLSEKNLDDGRAQGQQTNKQRAADRQRILSEWATMEFRHNPSALHDTFDRVVTRMREANDQRVRQAAAFYTSDEHLKKKVLSPAKARVVQEIKNGQA